MKLEVSNDPAAIYSANVRAAAAKAGIAESQLLDHLISDFARAPDFMIRDLVKTYGLKSETESQDQLIRRLALAILNTPFTSNDVIVGAARLAAGEERLRQAESEFTNNLNWSNIGPPKAKTHGPTMQRETTFSVEGNQYKATTTLQADRYVSGGVTYLPFPLAAAAAQTTEKSLRDWIRKDVRFNGRPIKTHRSPTGKLCVSEESIQRVANRFIKWPSKDQAGPVSIGETDDHSGFLPMSDAAGILGISARTMWLWGTQGKAPTDKPLDVIKCTTSNYFYIREKDVYDLHSLIPRSGLQRGRRAQLAPQP